MVTRKGSPGGKATAIISRARAIERYLANPNICLQCGGIIPVRDNECAAVTRYKKFCNHVCAAIHNNAHRIRKKRVVICRHCKKNPVDHAWKKMCRECQEIKKSRTGKLSKTQVGRRSIAGYARDLMKPKGKSCQNCGYSKHVEVCHKKAISTFPATALIKEINSLDNLILLCPNCHWEFDHKK
jgi:hypothetical protein